MSTNKSMNLERLAEARAALNEALAQWGGEYGADLLVEVERLRALTTVDDAMVERALRQSYGPKVWQEMCDSGDDCDVALVATGRGDMRDTLNAALAPREEA